MSIEFNSIQPCETQVTQVRLDSESCDLDHVETFKVTGEAQAALDREHVKFLETKNAHLENLCDEPAILISLAAFCLNRAQRLLDGANKAPFAPRQHSRPEAMVADIVPLWMDELGQHQSF